MKKHVLTVVFVLGLSAAVALAQAAPGSAQSGSSGNYPAASGANNPDQMGQSSAPMSEQQPGAKESKENKKDSSMANVDDETLHRQVHEQLASNPDLQNVQVTVKNGVVTLDGTVPKKEDRKEAKKLAKSVPGVRSVKEHLSVNASASAATPSSSGGISGQTSAGAATENPPSSQSSSGAVSGQAGATSSTTAGEATSMGQTSSTTGTTSGMGQTSSASSAAGAASPCSSLSSQGSASASGQAGAAGAAASGGLASQIQSEICKDPNLASTNITVSQEGNQIVLSGTAPSTDAKDKASDIAMRYANGMSLVNNIQVSGQAGTPPETAGGISGSVGGAVPSSAGQAGVGEQAGATSSTTQPSVSGQAGVGAQTPESGAAASAQTGAAGSATGSQSGTAMSSGDDQLKSQIETALRQEPTLSNDNINVNLTADQVELSGTVANGKDRQTAKRIAESFAGNRKVVDHLTVTGQGSNAPPDKN